MYFLWGNKVQLLLLLVIIGFTDVFDGYFARKMNKQTLFGSWIDSIADFVFFIVFIVLVVMFESETIVRLQYIVGVIIILKLLSGITGLIRFRQPGFLHTIGNKIANTVIITGICIFVLIRNTVVVEIGLYISILSALEEFLILLFGKIYNPNINGIWEKRFFNST